MTLILGVIGSACAGNETPQPKTPPPPPGDLCLTLPFCEAKALEASLDVRVGELREAVENERRSGACLSEISYLKPVQGRISQEELERAEGHLEFALAFSSPQSPQDTALRRLAARRLIADTAFLYFSAAAVQKALEDTEGMLPQDEVAKLKERQQELVTELLRSICLTPVTGIKLETGILEETVADNTATEPEEPESPEVAITAEDGRKATFKLQNDFLSSAPNAGPLSGRRLWLVAACKSARNLLNPILNQNDVSSYTALANLARKRIGELKIQEARESLAKEDAAVKNLGTNPSRELAEAIVTRDLALGFCCAAIAAMEEPGLQELQSNIPEPASEPPDPTLVEDTNAPNEEGKK